MSKLNFKTKYNVNDGIDELIKFIKSNKFENKSLFGNYNIDKNEKIRVKVESIEKEINKNKDDSKEKDNDKKKDRQSENEDKKEALLQRKINGLRSLIHTIQLPSKYIPNTREHLKSFDKELIKNAFSAKIEDSVVEKIMLLEVNPIWKILLMMGIGVFAQHKCVDYVSIMKELAHQQKLYLII